MGLSPTSLSNTLALRLVQESLSTANPSRTAALLNQAAAFLLTRVGFESEAAHLRIAVRSEEMPVQREALAYLQGHARLTQALVPYAEELARTALLEHRIGEYQAVVRSAQSNPVPWWFDARFPVSGKDAISAQNGTLAAGGLQALNWLAGIRTLVEAGRLPEGFSPEPYLLWIPDELYDMVFLNELGGFYQEGSGFQRINGDESIRIRALAPLLTAEDYFVLDTRRVINKGAILRNYWSEDDVKRQETVYRMFQKKYQTVRGVREIREDDGMTTLILQDGSEKVLMPYERLRSYRAEPSLTRWAFRLFRNQIRTSDSRSAWIGNEEIKAAGGYWISYDLAAGGFLQLDIWNRLKELRGLSLFINGGPHMEGGVYHPDRGFKPVPVEEGTEGIVHFLEAVVRTVHLR